MKKMGEVTWDFPEKGAGMQEFWPRQPPKTERLILSYTQINIYLNYWTKFLLITVNHQKLSNLTVNRQISYHPIETLFSFTSIAAVN